ncbi:MAG: PepSY domain-containing protein [Gammaproteobacteria bacterium]|nr:PepSY domain-containing protein [Gammaproteobacteria bacterium]MDH5630269.1 PepSY domain-containing protein [Gammaproteobacteria bacterium]
MNNLIKNMSKYCFQGIGVFCLLFSLTVSVSAKEKEALKFVPQRCEKISVKEAIELAKMQIEGKVVGVKLNDIGEHSVYRVRILDNNKRMKNVTVKACEQ